MQSTIVDEAGRPSTEATRDLPDDRAGGQGIAQPTSWRALRASQSLTSGDSAPDGLPWDHVIGSLYVAAAGAGGWIEPLRAIGVHLDACAVTLRSTDDRSDTAVRAWWSNDAHASLARLRAWEPGFPGADRVAALPEGAWFDDHEDIPAPMVARSSYFQERVLGHGGRWVALMKVTAGRESKMRPMREAGVERARSAVVLTAVRALGKPPFERERLADVSQLRHHLSRAMDLDAQRPHDEILPVRGPDLLDCFGRPIAMVGDDGRLLYANQTARRLLDGGDPFVERDGRLQLRRDEDDRRLRQALLRPIGASSAIADARRIVNARRVRDGSMVSVVVLTVATESLPHGLADAVSALLVFIDPYAPREVDAQLLAESFNLTRSEARVAAQLAQGARLETIAQVNRVSVATIRTQLKSLFAKTGVNRQSDLVRLVNGLPDACGLPALWNERRSRP